MSESSFTVTIAKDLEDLVPVFLRNRNKELGTLRDARAAGEWEQLRQLGHRMKGVGNSYGFERVSTLGKLIEDAARTSDGALTDHCIAEYQDYLSKVRVVYE